MDRLFLEEAMESVQLHAFLGGEAAVFSTRAPDKDTPNEDAVALLGFDAESGVALVCDGAGGSPAGEQAASLIVREMITAVDEARQGAAPLRSGILNGLEAANREILALGLGAASTCSAVEIQGGLVRGYQVGDSTILVAGQRGRVKYHSIAHSPVGFALESGLMDEQEAIHHEDRHVVSNLVGSHEMRIEMGPSLRLASHDTLIVASDGVFDNLLLDEVLALIRKGPLAQAAQRLVERGLQRMQAGESGQPSKPDDLSFILFRRPRRLD